MNGVETQIGPYRLEQRLGSGRAGEVWRAQTVRPTPVCPEGTRVALRLIHRALLAREDTLSRLVAQLEVSRAVLHPALAECLDVDVTFRDRRAQLYVVSELVPGAVASTRRCVENAPSPDAWQRWVGSTAQALEALHAAGRVHGGIRGSNLLLAEDGRAMLTDAGLDRALGTDPGWGEEESGAAAGADLSAWAATLLACAPEGADAALVRLLESVRGEAGPATDLVAKIREITVAGSDAADSLPALLQAVPRSLPFCARETQMAELRVAWGRACAGRGELLVLEGPAGTGKSRLVAEFAQQACIDGAHVLAGAFSGGSAGALASIVRTALEDPRLAHGLRGDLTDEVGLDRALDRLVGECPAPDGPVAPLDPALALRGVVRVLERGSSSAPLLLVLEDLHLAAEDDRRLLAALARHFERHRILCVATSRPVFDGVVPVAARRVGVEDLPQAAVQALVESRLGRSASASTLGLRVWEAVGGNPFLVCEVLSDLRRTGVVSVRADGRWTVRASPEGVRLPPSATELLEVRLAGLGAATTTCAELLACNGGCASIALLATCAGLSDGEIAAVREELAGVNVTQRRPGADIAFTHDLVRAAVFARIPDARRRRHHGRLAAAYDRRGETFAARACTHWLRSDEPQRALPEALSTLRQLAARSREAEVVDLARQCIEVCPRDDARLLGSLHAELGRALARSGRVSEAVEPFEAAVRATRACGATEPLAKLRRERGDVLAQAGRMESAIEELTAARDAAAAEGDLVEEASALLSVASSLVRMGRIGEAADRAREALALAERSGDPAVVGRAHVELGKSCHFAGRVQEAVECYRAGVDALSGTGDVRSSVSARLYLGTELAWIGASDASRELLTECFAAARSAGLVTHEAHVATSLAGVLINAGEMAAGMRWIDRAVEAAEDTSDPGIRTTAYVAAGYSALLIGDYERARRRLESAIVVQRRIGMDERRLSAQGQLASVLQLQGDVERALELATQVETEARGSGLLVTAAIARGARACCEEAAGSVAAARTSFRLAVAAVRMSGRGIDLTSRLLHELFFELRQGLDDAIVHARAARVESTLTASTQPLDREVVGLLVALTASPLDAGVGERLDSARRGLPADSQVQLDLLHWRRSGRRESLLHALRTVERVREQAPVAVRERMLRRVPLFALVIQAWRRTSDAAAHPPGPPPS